jgi:hypothetical protein
VPSERAYLPAYANRKEFWTTDGNTIRWLGVVHFAAGGALRISRVFVLGRQFSGLVAIQPGHTLVTSGVYGVILMIRSGSNAGAGREAVECPKMAHARPLAPSALSPPSGVDQPSGKRLCIAGFHPNQTSHEPKLHLNHSSASSRIGGASQRVTIDAPTPSSPPSASPQPSPSISINES